MKKCLPRGSLTESGSLGLGLYLINKLSTCSWHKLEIMILSLKWYTATSSRQMTLLNCSEKFSSYFEKWRNSLVIFTRSCHSHKYNPSITYQVKSMPLIWIWLVLWFCLSPIHKFTLVLWLYKSYEHKKSILYASVILKLWGFFFFYSFKRNPFTFLSSKNPALRENHKREMKWERRIFEIYFGHSHQVWFHLSA